MESRIASTDVLLLLFPRVEAMLNNIISKFGHDFDLAIDRKAKNYSTPAMLSLMAKCPHSYSSYLSAVDTFVNVARNSPESAISVLLTLLPMNEDHALYTRTREHINCYDQKAELYDLLIILFFADCVAQILTVKPDTQFSSKLLDLAYHVIQPYPNQYEKGLRLTIVKQFSVIVSLLSIHNLHTILTNFSGVFEKSNQTLFFVLHRFIRLSAGQNVTVAEIGDFVSAFNDLSAQIIKKDEALEFWAMAMCSLVSQLNSEDCPQLSQFLPKVFHTAYKKAHGKNVHIHHMALCSAIIMRETEINKKNYDDFLKNDILRKARTPKFLEESLNAFLVIIRGKYCSRTTQFWEWGSYNAAAHYGVEASHLFDPEQDQSGPGSFTSLFFKYFVGQSIEHYPVTTGRILVNFAARDFPFFIKTTIPTLIEKMGPDRSLLPLQYCLEYLVDPKMHFAEWAQTNPRNSSARVANEIPLLFIQMKQLFFSSLKRMAKKSLTKTGYCFTMTDSSSVPTFSLPMTTQLPSDNAKKRIAKFTISIGKKLDAWEFTESPSLAKPLSNVKVIESITEDEERFIKLLSLLPRIVNTSDLVANDFCTDLLTMTLTESTVIGAWTVRIINQIFVTLEDSRIIFYEKLVEYLSKVTDDTHSFILLQLLLKLLDLSLSLPTNDQKRVQEFVHNAQAMIIYQFTFTHAEIRDMLVLLIERLRRLGASFGVKVRIYDIMEGQTVTVASAVRYRAVNFMCNDIVSDSKLPEGLVTLREAASSKYDFLFRFFLCELATLFQGTRPSVLLKVQNLILERIPKVPDVSACGFGSFSNMFAVLTHLFPILNDADFECLGKSPLSAKKVHFYELPVSKPPEDSTVKEKMLQNSERVLAKAREILQVIISDPLAAESNKKLVDVLSFMSWTMSVPFLPVLEAWFEKKLTQKGEVPLVIMDVVGSLLINITQTPDFALTLASSDTAKSVFLKYFSTCEDLFESHNLCVYRQFEEVPEDVNIGHLKQNAHPAIEYCVVFSNFIESLTIEYVQLTTGPLKLPLANEWLESGAWPLAKRQRQFLGLIAWAYLSKSKQEAEFVELAKQSRKAIASLIRYAPLFDNDFSMNVPMEKLFLKMETNGVRVLPSLLFHHRDLLLSSFINYSFEAVPETSKFFFDAVCLQVFKSVDDNKFELLPSKKGRMGVNRLSQVKMVRSGSFREMQQTVSLCEQELTPSEVILNNALVTNAPKLILASLIYLLSDSYQIRCDSFKFLQRVTPVIRSILYPNSPKETAQMVAKIQTFAPTFYSTFMTITSQLVVDVCQTLSSSFPALSDLVISEALRLISTSGGASFASSHKLLLVQFIAKFLANETLCDESVKMPWPKGFTIYTSYTLLDALLDVFPHIECGAMKAYLSLWSEMAAARGDNISYILNFLMYSDASLNPANYASIKTILIHLADSYCDQVIEKLADKLTFARWFNANIQGHLEDSAPPTPEPISSIGFVLITLTELAQRSMERMMPKVHIIINFALLFYDREPALMADLLLVIFAYFPNCPEKLSSVFLPPASLMWPADLQPDSESSDKITETDIALKPYSKPPISVVSFVRQFVEFLKRSHKRHVMEEWGNECIRWICGCGDLVIAGRAAFIYAEVMKPMSDQTLQFIAQSLYLVCSAPQNERTRFYSIGCFRVFSAAIDKYYSQEQFLESFRLLFMIASAFLYVPDQSDICHSALAIVAKFILYSSCDNDDMRRLLQRLAALLATLHPQETLYAAFLAMFMREGKEAKRKISPLAFTVFLPTIYTAFAAYYNIHPFSGVMTDNDIPIILESAILMAGTSAIPYEFSENLNRMLKNPQSVMPDDFILQTCLILSACLPKVVTDAAEYIVRTARSAKDELLRAIFLVVACFIEAPTVTEEQVALYAPIAEIASTNSSPQASRLLEIFIQRTEQKIEVAQTIPQVPGAEPLTPSSWEDVIRKLQTVSKSIETMQIPQQPTTLSAPIFIVPLEPDIWTCEEITNVRSSMKDVTVLPFTSNRRMMEKAEEEMLMTERAREAVVVPSSYKAYTTYQSFLRNVETSDDK